MRYTIHILLMLLPSVIFLSLLFWPISLFLQNDFPSTLRYFSLALIIFLTWYTYSRGFSKPYFFLFILPFLYPPLVLLPLLFFVFSFFFRSPSILIPKKYFLVSLLLFFFFSSSFYTQSIFLYSRSFEESVHTNISAYSSPLFGRLFHNKLKTNTSLFSVRFFALTDPNNYFFGFHPREIKRENQNLQKFPFLGIFFLLYGIYFFPRHLHKNFFFSLFFACLFSLCFLTDFDRFDFLLYPLISIVYIYGITTFFKRYPHSFFLFRIFLVFSLIEFYRLFL